MTRCENCKYWNPISCSLNGKYGECRKNPPSTIGSKGKGFWPYTKNDDFCYSGTSIKQTYICED